MTSDHSGPRRRTSRKSACASASLPRSSRVRPRRVGHQVVGVDPDVLATVGQDRLGVTPQVLDQDAYDLRRGQPRVEPEGHPIVLCPQGVAAVVAGMSPRDVDGAEARVELEGPVVIGEGGVEVAGGVPGSAPAVVQQGRGPRRFSASS